MSHALQLMRRIARQAEASTMPAVGEWLTADAGPGGLRIDLAAPPVAMECFEITGAWSPTNPPPLSGASQGLFWMCEANRAAYYLNQPSDSGDMDSYWSGHGLADEEPMRIFWPYGSPEDTPTWRAGIPPPAQIGDWVWCIYDYYAEVWVVVSQVREKPWHFVTLDEELMAIDSGDGDSGDGDSGDRSHPIARATVWHWVSDSGDSSEAYDDDANDSGDWHSDSGDGHWMRVVPSPHQTADFPAGTDGRAIYHQDRQAWVFIPEAQSGNTKYGSLIARWAKTDVEPPDPTEVPHAEVTLLEWSAATETWGGTSETLTVWMPPEPDTWVWNAGITLTLHYHAASGTWRIVPPPFLWGVLNNDLLPDAHQPVRIVYWDGDSWADTLKDLETYAPFVLRDGKIPSGKRVRIKWCFDSHHWEVVSAEC
jgi:hypothetical protein